MTATDGLSGIEARVIELLRHGPLTGPELGGELEIGRGYLWNVLEGLRDRGLITATDTRRGWGRGRPARVYHVAGEREA